MRRGRCAAPLKKAARPKNQTGPRGRFVFCSHRQSGYRHELNQADHVRLLQRLCNIQGRAVIAGYPSQLYDELLQGWQRVQRPHRAAGSSRLRTEVLWIKP